MIATGFVAISPYDPHSVSAEKAFTELFRRATGREPYPYQVELATRAELPSVLDAPTGAGKTLAVLMAWLYRRLFAGQDLADTTPLRLVYALPMRVLVEQTWDEVNRMLGQLGLGPASVGRHLLMGGEVDDDWVLAPHLPAVLIGTVDMLLSRALNRGYALRRFRWPVDFGLLNTDCLWVLDETQLMGVAEQTAAQLEGLRTRFGTWRPCRTLWMSATVDLAQIQTCDHPETGEVLRPRSGDGDYELERRLHARKLLQRAEGDAASVLRAGHQPGTLSLAVLNTVERAVGAHRSLSWQPPSGAEVLLLHSRFRPPDRRRLVAALRQPMPAAGRVVCATQVVEAGVDLSARLLVTEVAPWSSLVQRLGRCNRFAEHDQGEVRWVDVERPAPYSDSEVVAARERLARLEGADVSPSSLSAVEPPPSAPSPLHVLRRRDLLDLFDTAPDLSGNDIDVSRFIRDSDDLDCQVFWRHWEGAEPPQELDQPVADELCPVPVGELRRFLKWRQGWLWEGLDARWRRLQGRELRPGMVVLLPAAEGGYSPTVGWDPNSRQPVPVIVPALSVEADANRADPTSRGHWLRLREHTADVVAKVEALWDASVPTAPAQASAAMRWAALTHDLGKAHPRFQQWLLACEAEDSHRRGTVWAKSPCSNRPQKGHPRHELASALALLLTGALREKLPPPWDDLVLHLVAAHHGKARVTVRAWPDDEPGLQVLGIREGDTLPEVEVEGFSLPATQLSLVPLRLGDGPYGVSWVVRVLSLRDHPDLGPFRIAHMEAVLRVADWLASAEEALGA